MAAALIVKIIKRVQVSQKLDEGIPVFIDQKEDLLSPGASFPPQLCRPMPDSAAGPQKPN
uniref:Uncharacterized protein n=1 Tax=Anguilla anguilla TaxID=7936 RepID=A0A0E9WUN5_ANGAN